MSEELGYGMHLIIDGFGASAQKLEDAASCERLLERIAGGLEPHARLTICRHQTDQGVSLGLALAETQLALHLYPVRRALCLDVFSRRTLSIQQVVTALRTGLDMGRFESHLFSRSRNLPRDSENLERVLRGERAYAGARLDGALLSS